MSTHTPTRKSTAPKKPALSKAKPPKKLMTSGKPKPGGTKSGPTTPKPDPAIIQLGEALHTLSFQAAGPARPDTVTGDAGVVLDQSLRELLGWRPREADGGGLLSALEQSFEKELERGLPAFSYKPRSYTVTSELSGEITGAQASLYSRAEAAVDSSLDLLDALTPLQDTDDEEAEAVLAVIRQRMSDLVNELARPAGPRVARVDAVFEQLLGKHPASSGGVSAMRIRALGPGKVGGRLGELRNHYGFDKRANVNTLEEERSATDFLIIVDYLSGLYANWLEVRDEFSGQRPFLGTQLVWLERLLSALAESVEEVRRSLVLVLIGHAEQLSLVLDLGHKGTADEPPILIDDLLDWILHFAAEEAPRLIQDGGRTAIVTEVHQTARQLRGIVKGITDLDSAPGLPSEFFYPVVTSAWRQLGQYLQNLVEKSQP